MGLTKDGFVKKTYSDLLDEMELKAQELFGDDINTKSYTPLGIIIRIFAWFLAIVWDTVEKVYNSRFIKKADGKSLDYHGGDKGLQRNPADYSYTILQFTGMPGYTVAMEELYMTNKEVYFMLIEDVTFDEQGNGTGEAVSVETGTFTEVEVNTITIQAEPVEQIYTVTNIVAATGGADPEQDNQYKQRLLQNNESNGKSTPNAILTALLNVTGVRSANVVLNRTLEIDVDGNPPKSIHAYVLGGAREKIADALLDSVGATSQTIGTEEVTVLDNSETEHIMRFDYGETVPIYIRVTIKTDSKFESNGVEQIKNSLISKIGGTDLNGIEQTGLKMGEGVILFQLSQSIQATGIADLTIEIGTSATNLASSNIDVTKHQVAETSIDNIEVIISA